VDNIDRTALRRVARIAWDAREQLALSPVDTEQVIIAWMAVGTIPEAEAASELLAARRAAESKQATFDRLLHRNPTA
jgi:hypothetical protein